MNGSMAENFVLFGYEDLGVNIILAPDVNLLLFLDGSALYESRQQQIVYPSCWTRGGERAFYSKKLCNTLN